MKNMHNSRFFFCSVAHGHEFPNTIAMSLASTWFIYFHEIFMDLSIRSTRRPFIYYIAQLLRLCPRLQNTCFSYSVVIFRTHNVLLIQSFCWKYASVIRTMQVIYYQMTNDFCIQQTASFPTSLRFTKEKKEEERKLIFRFPLA